MKNKTYPKLEIKSLLIAIVFSGIAHASFGQFQFSSSSAYRYSTAFDYGDECYYDAFRDADGVVYAIGQSDGPLQDDYSSTNNKIFINKFTSNGTLLWQKVIKDASVNYKPVQILELDSDSFLIDYEIDQGPLSPDSRKLSKLSKVDGTNFWTQDIPTNNWGVGIISDKKGRYAVLIDAMPDDSLTSVECFDTNGNSMWSKNIPFECIQNSFRNLSPYPDGIRNNYEKGTNLPTASFSSNGDIVFGGNARYSSQNNLPSFIRIDSNGNQVHSLITLLSSGAYTIASVCCDSDDNAYILNYIAAGSKLALTKISRNGSQLWQNQLSGYQNIVRVAIINSYIAVIEDAESTIISLYTTDGILLQTLSFTHNTEKLYDYSINSNGYIASVGSEYYSDSAIDATVRLRQLFATPVSPGDGGSPVGGGNSVGGGSAGGGDGSSISSSNKKSSKKNSKKLSKKSSKKSYKKSIKKK
jgi:hypothetical protein